MKTYSRKLAGRCADGWERGQGSRYHAITDDEATSRGRALCGALPGRRSAGWQDVSDKPVNCPKCIRKLQQHDQRAEDEQNYNQMIGESLRRY